MVPAFNDTIKLPDLKPTKLGLVASSAIIRKRHALANKLAHVGMRLHGFEEDDAIAWGDFWRAMNGFLQTSSYFQREKSGMTPADSIAVNALYEIAAAGLKLQKNLF